nr:FAD-dependent monooxygenase [Actinocrispum wychmicini]
MTDVLIVGGGPVGLLLAGELRLAGLDPLVLEATDGAQRRPRSLSLRGVFGRSTQSLRLRGLIEPLAKAQQEMFDLLDAEHGHDDTGADLASRVIREIRDGRARSHFSGLLLQEDIGEDTSQLRWYTLKQHLFEQLLLDWASELGVRVWHGSEVVDVVDEGGAVRAVLADGRTVRAPYLVGCDGGRSTVRKHAGIGFPGTEATMTGRAAIATLADPDTVTSHPRGPGALGGVSVMLGEIHTVEFDGGPGDRAAPVTLEEMQASIRRVSGVDATITSLTMAHRYGDATRQAATYRQGRILLAGDAAHVQSPIGGQGLNLGLQDAMNLGWKLGLVARGLAPETLLDTYTAERHPIGEWVLRNTRAQVALMRPGPEVEALRDVLAEVLAIRPPTATSRQWPTAPIPTTPPTRHTHWSAGSCPTWIQTPGTSSPCHCVRAARSCWTWPTRRKSAQRRPGAATACKSSPPTTRPAQTWPACSSARTATSPGPARQPTPTAYRKPSPPGSARPPRQRQPPPHTTDPKLSTAEGVTETRRGDRRPPAGGHVRSTVVQFLFRQQVRPRVAPLVGADRIDLPASIQRGSRTGNRPKPCLKTHSNRSSSGDQRGHRGRSGGSLAPASRRSGLRGCRMRSGCGTWGKRYQLVTRAPDEDQRHAR